MKKLRVVHYINQFFGQIGGEEMASTPPSVQEGPIGPGRALQTILGDDGEVVATVICGDTYFAENIEPVVTEIINMIRPYKPDIVIAGPAFASGRYGISCAAICSAINKQIGVPALSGLNEENPGLDLYRKDAYFIKTGPNARTMVEDLKKIVALAIKLINNEPLLSPNEENYHIRGIKKNIFVEENSAARALDMLLKKYKGEHFETEIPLPNFDRVEAAKPIVKLSNARIALASDGGLVPLGNPDRIENAGATKWGYYSIEGLDKLDKEDYEIVHRGYDNTYVAEDPNRLLPVDAMRILEGEGYFGRLHHHYFGTTGLITSAENAKRMGKEMADQLLDDEVEGVILTST